MPWMHNFDLFLFDFDGLLVDTERLQFQAYVNTLANRGVDLGWDYSRFCQLAHLNASALREEICRKFPELEPLGKRFIKRKKLLIGSSSTEEGWS
jgi:beta-phosphoglucomutase